MRNVEFAAQRQRPIEKSCKARREADIAGQPGDLIGDRRHKNPWDANTVESALEAEFIGRTIVMQWSDDSPSEPVETIATEVRLRVGELTPSERRAAHALLSNYPFAGLETVGQFAKRAGVSAPSILRFVARFGFNAYADFQRRLKQELEAQVQSPLTRQAPVSAPGSRFTEFVSALTENVAGTFDALAPAEFDAILAVLADPKRRIHFVGGRVTEALAIYMARHLRVIRADVSLMEGHAATCATKSSISAGATC